MKSEILAVLDKYPNLNYFGFGLFDKGKTLTESQQKIEIRKRQDQLFSHIEEIEDVVNWLKDVNKIRSFNERHSSYGLKHSVENAVHRYVANGSFIVGAIISDFKIKVDTPNACFNMSEKSLKLKAREIDDLKRASK